MSSLWLVDTEVHTVFLRIATALTGEDVRANCRFINQRECDSTTPEPSWPLARFCGLASPGEKKTKKKLSCEEQKQVWGSEPAAKVDLSEMFPIRYFLPFSSRSWFNALPVRNSGLKTNVVFFFYLFFWETVAKMEKKRSQMQMKQPLKQSQGGLRLWGQDDIRKTPSGTVVSGEDHFQAWQEPQNVRGEQWGRWWGPAPTRRCSVQAKVIKRPEEDCEPSLGLFEQYILLLVQMFEKTQWKKCMKLNIHKRSNVPSPVIIPARSL